MRRPGADCGKRVEPRCVRERRGVEHRVVGRKRVDVGEIAHGHRREVSVAEHDSLRPACRARRVEQPCEVVGAARARLGEGGEAEQRREFRAVRGERFDVAVGEEFPVGGAGEEQPAPGVVEDPFRFAGVQFRVDRQRGGAGLPDRLHRHEIFAGIRHEEADAIARNDAVPRSQPGRQRPGVGGKTAIVAKSLHAAEQGGRAGLAARRPFQPQRHVHRPPPMPAARRRRLSARTARYCRTAVATETIRCRRWESSGRRGR